MKKKDKHVFTNYKPYAARKVLKIKKKLKNTNEKHNKWDICVESVVSSLQNLLR